MKKLSHVTILMLSLLLFGASHLFAYPVAAGDTIKFQDSGVGTTAGGEFKILDAISGDYLFSTFCLEYDEYLSYSATFDVVDISDMAEGGGVNTDAGDPLSAETKWLYWNFVTGSLQSTTSYTYTNAGIDALQKAIWFLEEEIKEISGLTEDLVNSAIAAVSGNAYIGDVKVMNIVWANDTSRKAQSQLIAEVAPVPEPSTFLLLGAGGGLLWLVRRRKASR